VSMDAPCVGGRPGGRRWALFRARPGFDPGSIGVGSGGAAGFIHPESTWVFRRACVMEIDAHAGFGSGRPCVVPDAPSDAHRRARSRVMPRPRPPPRTQPSLTLFLDHQI
jgi:hypothetical protein